MVSVLIKVHTLDDVTGNNECLADMIPTEDTRTYSACWSENVSVRNKSDTYNVHLADIQGLLVTI